MDIDFAASPRSTVGIEWELVLVDPVTRELKGVGPEIIRQVSPTRAEFPLANPEFLTNTVELVSGPHERVPDAMNDLVALLAQVQTAAAEHGVQVASAGTHPFSRSEDQQVTPDKERYLSFVDRMRWWGTQLLIWGLHVHVGVDHPDKAVKVMAGVLNYYPHLQALSASSPYYEGIDTGYASNRAMLYQQASTAGLPPTLHGWANYEQLVDDLVKVGVIADYTEVRWDVRPSPKWGTVEVRICDAPPTIREVAALTAFTQCLVEHLVARLDDDDPLPLLQPWYVRENKWRSARYGLECDAIVDVSGTERPVIDDTLDLLDRLDPIARKLGCANELRVIESIIDDGPGYQRQLSIAARHDDDRAAVVDYLVDLLTPATA